MSSQVEGTNSVNAYVVNVVKQVLQTSSDKTEAI